jgi:hypothetical protein
MNLSELCTTYVSNIKLKDEVERNVLDFCEAPWGLGLGSIEGVPPLYPVQKFIFKAYYNLPLDRSNRTVLIKDKFNEKERFRFTEEEYLHFLYEEGRINVKEITGNPQETRPNLCLSIGRRGTKTSTISVLVAYEAYKLLRKGSPQEYYKIMPDDEIRVSCIATQQHLERAEYFKKYRNKPTLTYMQLSTPRDIEQYGEGQRPSLRIVAAPCSGRGIRGHNNIVAILDEMAHFFEAESADDKSDEAIYDAVTPSVAKFNGPDGEPHGKVICISSPMNRAGKFFDLYERSMEPDCNDLLMIKAPTWEVDYTLSSKFLRAKYMENPLTYMTEYGAEFSDRVSAWIENEQVLRVNIIKDLRLKKMSFERVPHFMGIDVGAKNDGTAIAICHIVRQEVEGVPRQLIELDLADVRYAADEGKDAFHTEEIAEWIYSFHDKFFIVKGMMDQFLALAIVPQLHELGFNQIDSRPMTRDLNSRIYENLMSKMLDAALRIPDCDERIEGDVKIKDIDLVTEMLKLQATRHSKFMISVEAPQSKGSHDDLSDAYARAVFLATEHMSLGAGVTKTPVTETTSGSGSTYRKYLLKQKRSALYTMRPSTGTQLALGRGRAVSAALDRIATPLGGGRRWR